MITCDWCGGDGESLQTGYPCVQCGGSGEMPDREADEVERTSTYIDMLNDPDQQETYDAR